MKEEEQKAKYNRDRDHLRKLHESYRKNKQQQLLEIAGSESKNGDQLAFLSNPKNFGTIRKKQEQLK